MSTAIKRAIAVVTVIAAFAAVSAPAASARFDLNPSRANQPAQPAAPVPYTSVSSSTSSSGGFSWGDAAVGAGVALALVGVAGGALLITRRGRTASEPATTS
jgi:hypothetical protein